MIIIAMLETARFMVAILTIHLPAASPWGWALDGNVGRGGEAMVPGESEFGLMDSH